MDLHDSINGLDHPRTPPERAAARHAGDDAFSQQLAPSCEEVRFERLQALRRAVIISLTRGFGQWIALAAWEETESTAGLWLSDGRHEGIADGAWNTWVRVVARNAARTIQGRRTERLPDESLLPPAPDDDAGKLAEIEEAHRRLPAELRPVVRAVLIDGMSRREAARHLGVPASTIRRRFAEAVPLLRRMLAE